MSWDHDFQDVRFCKTTNTKLSYVAKQRDKSQEQLFCWIKVTNSFLVAIDEIAPEDRINALNGAIPGEAFRIYKSKDHKLLSKKCYSSRVQLKKSTGKFQRQQEISSMIILQQYQ